MARKKLPGYCVPWREAAGGRQLKTPVERRGKRRILQGGGLIAVLDGGGSWRFKHSIGVGCAPWRGAADGGSDQLAAFFDDYLAKRLRVLTNRWDLHPPSLLPVRPRARLCKRW